MRPSVRDGSGFVASAGDAAPVFGGSVGATGGIGWRTGEGVAVAALSAYCLHALLDNDRRVETDNDRLDEAVTWRICDGCRARADGRERTGLERDRTEFSSPATSSASDARIVTEMS